MEDMKEKKIGTLFLSKPEYYRWLAVRTVMSRHGVNVDPDIEKEILITAIAFCAADNPEITEEEVETFKQALGLAINKENDVSGGMKP